jgi:guanylate kinase
MRNTQMSKKGNIYIISGPSGSGKSTVLKEVFAQRENYYFSISATTRSPRPGEQDGVEYFFITKERFQEMIENDEFLEYAQYVENSYGTPRKPVEDKVQSGYDVIMDIEVQGAKQVKEKLPEAISIFIAPPSLEELERRLRGRSTESEEKILGRLETARHELELSVNYDHKVINDEVSRAANEILSIMRSHD